MLQLNGIVGGNAAIPVRPGKSKDLQLIVINVKKGKKLVLRRLNFLLSNDAFDFVIKPLPSPGVFRFRGGSGDLTPNRVLFNNNTGADVRIFFSISAVNRARNTRSLQRTDSWALQLAIV
ncbi:hypothetical protein LJK87_37845 [Paenibacillus sp. P25]|nr:hypothetical protein LJK87_37845 [Paenibacillus sp. P25]